MSPPTFPLYGYERFFAMDPNSSAKLAHVMVVRGDISTLITHFPAAVLATFNKHPKMRASILPGSMPQKAMVYPLLSDVAELEKMVTFTEREGEEQAKEWTSFVQTECERRLDREHDLPYYFHVFVDSKTKQFARVMLFADHYMSDLRSGTIILNDVLQHAVAAATEANKPGVSLPLRPSLYECMHWVNPWLSVLREAVSKWVIEPVFNFDQDGFEPLLPVDATTQQDFRGGELVPKNPSLALFSQGTLANMQLALARCEEEDVSLQGAMIAAATLAFGLAKGHGKLNEPTATQEEDPSVLHLKMDVSLNMRQRLTEITFPEDVVGLYTTSGNLVFTSSEGVHLSTTKFWDVARKAELECHCLLESHETKLQSMYANESLHAGTLHESKLRVMKSILSDTTVTNLDAYPYAQHLQLGSSEANAIEIENLHVYNSLPSLSSASMLFLTAVKGFNYSMMHKLEEESAAELFHWYVQCMENIGTFSQHDTLVQASERLTLASEGASVTPISSSNTF